MSSEIQDPFLDPIFSQNNNNSNHLIDDLPHKQIDQIDPLGEVPIDPSFFLKACISVPPSKVQPFFFDNTLLNPQFDIYNPVFGILEKISSKKEKGLDIEMANAFVSRETMTDDLYYDAITPNVMPYIPLRKEEKNEQKKVKLDQGEPKFSNEAIHQFYI